MHMREKLTNFYFNVKWIKGKMHMIADALLHAPVFQPEKEEEEMHVTAIHCLQVTQAHELMLTSSSYQAITRKLLNVCDHSPLCS